MSLPFRKLALGGGGVKGILHLGGLLELQKYQTLEFTEGIYGCSIGSVMATYLSFDLPVNDKLVDLTVKYLCMDKIIPKPSFQDLATMFSSKGLFNMKSFETCVLDMFQEVGIDLKDKKIGDSKYPLYIVASNITKGVPTIFSKDVPILDALKCSCCIPGMFKPQELYGQLYVDGGVFVPCLSTLVSDGLCFSLTKTTKHKITSKTIDSISPIEFMKDINTMTVNTFLKTQKRDLTVDFEYPNLFFDSDLAELDVQDILKSSQTLMRRFLISKSLLEEITEVADSGSADHLV